jgi:hypothetical protein
MTIKQLTYYYCTKCDKEYPDISSVYIRCVNDIHQEKDDGCESCMSQCLDPNYMKTKSHLKGCGRWFCNTCMETTKYFDNWYPSRLCTACVIEYGLEKFYGGAQQEELWKEIENWRFAEFGSKNKPKVKKVAEDGLRIKRYSEGEIQQRIFQRYYIPVTTTRRRSKDGVITNV